MRTTLDLPDELFRRLKAKAALKGESLKEMLTRYVESGLRQPDPSPGAATKRSKLPVIKRRNKRVIPTVTRAIQAKMEEEDDIGKLRRSFGR